MTPISTFPFSRLSAGLLGVSLWLGGCATAPEGGRPSRPDAPAAAADSPSLASVRTATYADNPKVLAPLDAAVAAAGLDAGRLEALAAQLVDLLQSTEVSPAVRQVAAERLGLILGAGSSAVDETVARVGEWLADEATAEAARLVLSPVPGAAVDDVFLQALGRAQGRARLGLIQSLGERRVVAAVPALAGLLAGGDAATADLAIWALGRIGGAEGQAALAQARDPWSATVLNARLAAAARDEAEPALKLLREIHSHPSAPLAQRAAALRGMIARDPGSAVATVLPALAGTEPAFRLVALEAVTGLSDPAATEKIAGALPTLAPATRAAVITALGHRGDAAAAPALRAAARAEDAAVRSAAIDALGRLPGDLETALLLARLATQADDEGKAAAAALARLDAPGMDGVIRAGAAAGDPALRGVFLRQLAQRNQTEAVPDLLGLRGSPDASLRLAALEALGDLAGRDQLEAMLDWTLQSTDRAEQTRAIRSLIAMVLRDDAVDTRLAPVITAMTEGGATAQTVLLPVLSRAGGGPGLALAARLALSEERAVASGAVAQLARWPDNTALDALLAAAADAADVKVRSEAMTGATRILERGKTGDRSTWPALLGRLLTLPVDGSAKDRLFYLLSLCDDPAALRVAEEQAAAADAPTAARDAALAVRANLMWPPIVAASDADAEAANAVDRKGSTWWQVPARDGVWLRLDLKTTRPIRSVTLDQTGRNSRFPVEVEVCVSDNPTEPGDVRARAKGTMTQTVITLPPGVRGRYLLLRHAGERAAPEWAVNEVRVE